MSVQTGVVQVQPEVEVVAKAERRRFTSPLKTVLKPASPAQSVVSSGAWSFCLRSRSAS